MKPTKSDTFRRLYISIVVTICIGLLLSIGVFFYARNWESSKIQADFNLAAWNRISSLKRQIENDLEILTFVHLLYESSEFVTRDEFRTFCKSTMSRHHSIQALEWIPLVPHSQREAYEKAARNEGFPDFQITKRGKQNKMVRADKSKEYFPVYYVEPYKGNEPALGFDLATNPVRLEALSKSRQTGEMAATSRITLVQERGIQYGFLIFLPFYQNQAMVDTPEEKNQNLIGFLTGIFRIGDIVESSLNFFTEEGIDINIFDTTNSQGAQLLYFHPSRLRPDRNQTSVQQKVNYDELYVSHTFNVADRKWSVQCRPIREFIEHRRTWYPWVFLVGGLSFTGLFSMYLKFRISRTIQVEQLISNLSTEVTERKLAERELKTLTETLEQRVLERTAELQKSEEKYRELFDTIIDGIVFTDLEGNILDGNKEYLDMLGYSMEEIKKKKYQDITPPKWHDMNDKIVREQVIKRGYSDLYEKEYIRKDGTVFPISIKVWLVRNEEGNVKGMWAIVRDITERKQMEENMRRSYKMASLGRLTAGVFHEVLNPLQIISSYTQLMLLKKEKDSERETYLKKILKEIERIVRITDSLLMFSRNGKENFEDVEINSLLENVVSIIEPNMNFQNIIIIKDYEDKTLKISGNSDKLRQVFLNLISNSTDAMPEGGNLKISTQKIENLGEPFVRITFKDTGCGIKSNDIKKVFDPFFTTKSEGEGTGLGLSISYGIIKSHGGEISVNSKEGKGSTFIIDLPIKNED